MAIPGSYLTTLSPFRPLNSLLSLPSTTPSSILNFHLEVFLDTAVPTFNSCHRVYHAAAKAKGSIHPVAYTTVCFLWRELTPSVIVMKPRSDLCWQCQQNSTAIVRTANHPEADKSAACANALKHCYNREEALQDHLQRVQRERSC